MVFSEYRLSICSSCFGSSCLGSSGQCSVDALHLCFTAALTSALTGSACPTRTVRIPTKGRLQPQWSGSKYPSCYPPCPTPQPCALLSTLDLVSALSGLFVRSTDAKLAEGALGTVNDLSEVADTVSPTLVSQSTVSCRRVRFSDTVETDTDFAEVSPPTATWSLVADAGRAPPTFAVGRATLAS